MFSADERRRFGALGRPELAWQLLYRLEPELYDRLAGAERLHPAILDWLPRRSTAAVEVAAGCGRLTLDLAARCRALTVIDPAAPLRALLARRLARAGRLDQVRLLPGFFDALPLADGAASLVITCSAFTPSPATGGEAGLAEMQRVCRLGGRIVIVRPHDTAWLRRHGFRYVSFPGAMAMEFASVAEALDLTAVFYPQAREAVWRLRSRTAPYAVLGVPPPCDLAWKTAGRS